MQREQLLAELRDLANRAKDSEDSDVEQSAVVLFGLMGAITAGDTFFEAFVDQVAGIIQNQLVMISDMLSKRA